MNEETLLSIAISDVFVLVLRPDHQDFQGTAVTVEVARKLRDRGPETGEEKLSRGILIVLERHIPALEALLGSS